MPESPGRSPSSPRDPKGFADRIAVGIVVLLIAVVAVVLVALQLSGKDRADGQDGAAAGNGSSGDQATGEASSGDDTRNSEVELSQPGEATADALVGRWIAIELLGSKITSAAVGDEAPFLEFRADGTLSFYDGCNWGSGPWSYPEPGGFAAGEFASTRRACRDGEAFDHAEVLGRATTVIDLGQTLEFRDAEGGMLGQYGRG